MDLQRTWRKRQQHRVHNRTSARRGTLLVHGRVRAQDPLREPTHKTRVLTSSRNKATLPHPLIPVSRFFWNSFREPKLSTPDTRQHSSWYNTRLKVGVHVSISGSIDQAVDR